MPAQANSTDGQYTTQGAPGSTDFTIDPSYNDHVLAGQLAKNASDAALAQATLKAQTAYQSKLIELQKQGLGQQAQQIAQQYAMSVAQLEFQKSSFQQTYGLNSQQQGWQQVFDTQQADLDNKYKVAEQTGFRDGVPTLAQAQMNQAGQIAQAQLTQNQNQFNAGQALNSSQFQQTLGFNQAQLGQNQNQFNVTSGQSQQQIDNQVAQYKESLQQQAAQFGVTSAQQQQQIDNQVAQFKADQEQKAAQFAVTSGQSQQQINNQASQFGVTAGMTQQQINNQNAQFGQTFGEGQRQFNVSSVLNAPRGPADWAAYTNRLRGLQGSGSLPGNLSSFGSVAPVASYSNGGQQTGPVLSNTDLALAATGQGNPAQLQGTTWQGMYGGSQQGGAQMAATGASNMSSGSSANYGGGPSAYGGPAGGNSASGASNSGGGSSSDISLPSLQKYRRYSPDEQQMGLGALSENGGPTAEDSQYLMQRQSANYAQSRGAKMQGM